MAAKTVVTGSGMLLSVLGYLSAGFCSVNFLVDFVRSQLLSLI